MVTGAAAHLDMHRLRAQSSAIITGINSVLANGAAVTVRLPIDGIPGVKQPSDLRHPCGMVLDSAARLPEDASILQQPGSTLVMHGANNPLGFEHPKLETAPIPLTAQQRIELPSTLDELARRGANEVLFEYGVTLAGNILQAGLVDELVVYMAPYLLGDTARGLAKLPSIQYLNGSIDLIPITNQTSAFRIRVLVRLALLELLVLY